MGAERLGLESGVGAERLGLESGVGAERLGLESDDGMKEGRLGERKREGSESDES